MPNSEQKLQREKFERFCARYGVEEQEFSLEELGDFYSFPKVGTVGLKKTANAWWKDTDNLTKLLNGFRNFMTQLQACYEAGISEKQLRYFLKVHPYFGQVIELVKAEMPIKAKELVYKGLTQDAADPNFALKVLERIEKENFSTRSELTGKGGEPITENPKTTLLIDSLLTDNAGVLHIAIGGPGKDDSAGKAENDSDK